MLSFKECLDVFKKYWNDSKNDEIRNKYGISDKSNDQDDNVLFWIVFKTNPDWNEEEKMLYSPLDGPDGFAVSKKDGLVTSFNEFLDYGTYSSDDGQIVDISGLI